MASPVVTRVLRCDPASISFPSSSAKPSISCSETLEALATAAQHLNALQTVAFPTETVYGLGALALDPTAASRIYTTKGRPSDNPLIVHVSSPEMLQRVLPLGYTLPRTYEILISHFWPGALTLIFPSDPSIIPPIISGGAKFSSSVAIRMPSHPVARALIALVDAPIAAPSANISGKPSPTKAEHVLRDLNGRVGLILDGGACGVGLESTVIDGLNPDGNVRVLRPGGVTVEEIERVLAADIDGSFGQIPRVLVHRRDYQDKQMEEAPTTPGMKYRHYSPSVPVTLLNTTSSVIPEGTIRTPFNVFWSSLQSAEEANPVKVGIMTPSDSPLALLLQSQPPKPNFSYAYFPLGSTSDPALTAHLLFDGLLTLESQGVDSILVEEIKEEREGLAVMNRVRKAAGSELYLQL